VQPPTVTAAVGRLEQQGLVERQPDPDDRRIARVIATRKGRKLLARNRSRKTAFLTRRLAELDDDERARLAAAVEILERVLEPETDGARAP
jgi:DNA-binding MarR family transcriptional regulator